MPPPLPRSSTTSPGFSSASAVGLPQPSEASTAASGSSLFCNSSYNSDVIGSAPDEQDEGLLPQQALPCPDTTRSAA